jgi:hypothetical protein
MDDFFGVFQKSGEGGSPPRHLNRERTRSMPPDDPETPVCHLAPLERTVVALALRDPLWSVPAESPAGPRHWFRRDDPRGRHMQLANPRLEALRRFVVLRRHGQGEGVNLLTAGFSPGQILETLTLARLQPGL